MSVLPTLHYPDRQGEPAEAFGQAGVRQYAGRLLFWVFVTLGLASLAMAQRSVSYTDVAEWKGRGQMMQIVSGNGSLAVWGASGEKLRSDVGWSYRGGYGSARWTARANASAGTWGGVGRLIGIETRYEVPFHDLDRAVGLRVNWVTLAVIFLIQPVVFVVRRVLRHRRSRAAIE